MFLGYGALALNPNSSTLLRVLQQRQQREQQALYAYHFAINTLCQDWHLIMGQQFVYPDFVEPADTAFTVQINARIDYAEGIARQMGFFPLARPQPITLEQIIERLNAVRDFPARLIGDIIHTERELIFLIGWVSNLIKPEEIARFNLMDIRDAQRYEERNWGEAIRERLNIVVAAVQFIGTEAGMEPFVLTEPLQEENMVTWAHRRIRAMLDYLDEPYEALERNRVEVRYFVLSTKWMFE